jgi:hypothetical protein
VGLKALIRGLGVGGRKRKKEKKKVKPMDCVPWGIFGIL